jgi:dienelactone hydrolase
MKIIPLEHLLGDLPQNHPISAELLQKTEQEGYVLESLMLDLNGMERVPAYVALPLVGKGPFPLVVFNHSHGGNYSHGRKELILGSSYLQQPSFASELTAMGYAVCCIDMWGFNERSGKTESELVKEMLWRGKVLWGMMLYDNMRMLDYMTGRSDIDNSRIATIGMSMGGLMSWWLAALDERVKVIVDLCGQVDAHTLIAKRGLDHHGFYSYVPNLLKYYTTLQIQERIAPRPRMSLVGKDDRMCPIEGVEHLAQGLQQKYKEAGVPDHFQAVITTGGHMETLQMRVLWREFLQKYL